MKKIIFAALILFSSLANAETTPCKGKTKAGANCKSTIVSKATGYCHAHDPSRIKCQGTTKAGKPCGQIVTKGNKFCRFHIH